MTNPTITSVEPASGPAGTRAIINGTGFGDDIDAVKFGEVSVGNRFSAIRDTQMVAEVPAGTGAVDLSMFKRPRPNSNTDANKAKWHDLSGNGNDGVLTGFAYESGDRPRTNTETDKAIWHDRSGYGRDATLVNFFSSAGDGWEAAPDRLHFPGDGSYVNLPAAAGVASDKVFAFDMWAAITPEPTLHKYLWCERSASTHSASLRFPASHTAVFLMSDGAETKQISCASPAFDDGNVHHFACTCDGSLMRLYIDGVERGTATAPPAGSIPAATMHYLGAYAASGVGVQDHYAVRNYSTALSAAQVAQNYAAGPAGTGYVRTNLALDLNAARAVRPSGWIGDGSEASQRALALDGRNDVVTVADEAALRFGVADFSIDLWVTTPIANGFAYGGIVSKGWAGWERAGSWALNLLSVQSPSSTLMWFDVDVVGGPYNGYTTLPALSDGLHHIVITRQGTSFIAYNNGAQLATWTTPHLNDMSNTYPVLVGSNDWGRYIGDAMPSVRLYNGLALTPAQIAQNHAAGPNGSGYVTDNLVLDLNAAGAIWEKAKSASALFTYDAAIGPSGGGGGSPPTVTSVVPDTAVDNDGGDVIAIHGTGFITTLAVRFGSDDWSAQGGFTVVDDTELSVVTPAGSGTVDIVVVNSYGESAVSAADEFTYPEMAVPVVTSIAPIRGFAGRSVNIVGSGFTDAEAVLFGEETAAFVVNSDTSISAIIPDGTGSVHITVENAGGPSTTGAGDLFTYGTEALPETTATNTNPNGYEGWAIGDVTVTLVANANGGYGIEATYYQLDLGGITKYAGPFVVSGAGSHQLQFWSVDVRGNREPVNIGYVNILSASAVPTGLTLTPGIGFISAKWDNIVAPRPVTYKVYIGAANPPTTLYAASSANVVSIKRANADGLTYVAVSSVDVAGNESVKCAAQSTTAIATAADLADHAISQAKLALNIRPPAIVAALPTLPATEYPVGATVFLTTDSCLYKTTNGTTWVKLIGAGDIQADGITAGQIAAGAIGADELAANSVYAKNIVVANFTNLVPNPMSEQALPSGLTLPVSGSDAYIDFRGVNGDYYYEGAYSRRCLGGAPDGYVCVSPDIPVVPGERYYMSCYGRMGVAGPSTGVGLYAQIRVGAGWSGFSTAKNNTTAWTKLEVAGGNGFLIPAGATFMRLFVTTWADDTKYGYVDNIMLRLMADGSLIVDGAITTNKLDALAVTAAKIAANTITADKLNVASVQAGIVTAAAIAAVNITAANITGGNIAGVIITGGTVRTASSGQRMELNSAARDKLYMYSGSSDETSPAYIAAPVSGDMAVQLKGVQVSAGGGATLRLETDVATGDTSVDAAADTIDLHGLVQVTCLKPAVDYSSGGSADGIWIQNSYASALSGRWKLTFNSSTKKLIVSNGTNTYSTAALT